MISHHHVKLVATDMIVEILLSLPRDLTRPRDKKPCDFTGASPSK